MIIHSPIFSGSITQDSNHAYANLSGSFSGSFTGIGNFTGLEADSVEFDNVLNKPALVSGSQQVIDLLPTGVVSGSTQLTTELDARYLNTSGDGIVSGSSQITLSSTTGYSSFSSSLDSRISTEKGRIDAILSSADANADTFAEIVTLINSVDTTNDNAFASFYTSSNATDTTQNARLTSLEAYSSSNDNTNTAQNARLTSIESVTGSYETKGRGIVSGSSQITPLLPTGVVSGSSQLTTEFDSRYLNTSADGVISGSAQIKDLLPAGSVSGSSQVIGILSSLNDYTGSNNTNISNQQGRLDSLELFSGSQEAKDSTLATYTASIDAHMTAANQFATSQLGKDSTLATYTGSIDTKFATLATYTGSIDTTIKTKLNVDGVISGSATDVKTFLSLGNVTNESKATMFSSPTFTGTVSGVSATHVGLGNVTNESKGTMFTSPSLTGTPIAPTAAANTNSTQIATTAYVQQELTDLIGGANEAFDTLLEISASLASGDSTLNTLVDGKLAKASNLSDLTDTSSARTNLGLVIGTNVQAYNSTLASVAGGTYSGDDSITTIGTVTAGSVTSILPTGTVSGSSQINVASTTGYSTISSHIANTSNPHSVTAAQVGLGNVTNESKATMFSSPTFTGTVSGVTATHVGLGNVNNTSDASKPVSTATQTALDLKLNIAGAGVVSGSSQISHDSTTGFVANKHIDHTAVTLTAGNGLTGGGDISASRTFNVVGGNGITVNADNIELAGTYTGTWAVTGGITATADVVAYSASDRRLKDNIQNIENPIEKVQQLNGVTWDWNDNATELQKSIANVGVIAQEVEAVLPQLIQHRDTGYLAVDYAKLTGLLIEAIKEQQKQIDELKSKLK